jgi:hypothetical protein
MLEVPAHNYLWPTNTNKSITTLFGEKRSRRFHAGIDVRTLGRIGDKIFAVESGYISRIKVSSDGYGKAIYLKLNDGNTILYAHLDKFHDFMEVLSQKYQIEKESNFIDIYFNEYDHIVNKGDIVGYCGDSGSISGPHLHFEIRDSEGRPLNPLTNYYSVSDTLKPIAESLAFIPLDKNCYINGHQNYEILDLTPLELDNNKSIYKYFLEDTVSVIGKFGLALNTYDRINQSPFNFGIYEIQMMIDNKEVYRINFDEYSFSHDHLIYKEIDFNLLQSTSKNYHRLFINDNSMLDFISKKSNSGINIDKNFHNLVINISDNYSNKIQVQAVIKGDILHSPIPDFDTKNLSLYFKSYPKNIDFNLMTRYGNSRKIPVEYSIFDSTTFKFSSFPRTYDVLEYSLSEQGLKSLPRYISLSKYDPLRISGEFNLKHFDNNIMITFDEDEYTGYEADLIIDYKNNRSNIMKMNRFNKNELSSGLLDLKSIDSIQQIHIKYKTNPEIIFTKSLTGEVFNDNKDNLLIFDNLSITASKNAIYNDTFFWIEDIDIKVPKEFNVISDPISIMPNNIPFKKYIQLSFDENTGAIFTYNKKNDKWIYSQDSKDKNLITKINSGNIFAILNEDQAPVISNIFPSNGSKYDIKDINTISFNVKDAESGINKNSVKIYLNDRQLYYEYIPYRNLIRATIDPLYTKDKNLLNISAEDNLGNIKKHSIIFYKK